MRIISGKFKGTILQEPSSKTTRPTMDRIKQSLFDVLFGQINKETSVLDLFAGSGSLGLESLSRGADEAVFVDADKEACKIIKSNLAKLKLSAMVLNCDYAAALKQFSSQGKKFNLIFLDPPYQSGLGEQAIEKIIQHNILTQSGTIIFETDSHNQKSQTIQSAFPALSARKLKYGDKLVFLLKNNQQ